MNVAVFTSNPFEENTYVIWNDGYEDAAIIDPGMNTDADRKKVDDFLAEHHLNLKYLFLTHMHLDHAWSANYIRNKYSLQIMCAEEEQLLGFRMTEQANMFGVYNSFEPVVIDNHINDGDKFNLAGETIEVIQVPGHSPGGLTFYCEKSGMLFCGDVLFYGSVGRTDLPGGSMEELVYGIKHKLFVLPDETTVFSGHGYSTTIGFEKHHNYVLSQF